VIRYSLPYPPTTNNLFRNAGSRRVKTERYSSWLIAAGNQMYVQGRKRISGPVSLSIALRKPDKRKRDISNTIKAVEDLLVSMAVIDDDSLVQRLSVAWDQNMADECVVLIQAAEEGLAA
jgi:crossover junction endodeoxyribonuclease RusA